MDVVYLVWEVWPNAPECDELLGVFRKKEDAEKFADSCRVEENPDGLYDLIYRITRKEVK